MLKTFILVIKLILKIICSTFDVKSDLVLSISLYSLGHPIFATLLITPFIINYVLTWICWGRLDENKRVSWIAAGLAIYPQYCAGQIIYLMRTDKDRDVTDGNGEELIISDNPTLFWLAYLSSIFSSTYGLAKCLRAGPCRIMPEGGGLGGVLRFILLFGTMFCKLTMLAWVAMITFTVSSERGTGLNIVLYSLTMFLPSLVMAMLSLCHTKDGFSSIIRHPSLLCAPLFSYFTFSTNKQRCCKSSPADEEEISLSRYWTIANMVLSFLGYVVFGIAETSMVDAFVYFIILVPVLTGPFFTIFFLFDHRLPSCMRMPELQFGVYKVKDPLVEYVRDESDGGNAVQREN